MPAAKTLEEHVEFVHEMTALQLWSLWRWLADHPEEQFCEALRKRTDLQWRTRMEDGVTPGNSEGDHLLLWGELAAAALAVYERTRDGTDPSGFEHEALDVFRDCLDARARSEFPRGPQQPGYQCGSLKYDPPRQDRPDRVFFHIANAVALSSIFDDPRYLPECLLLLIEKSHAEFGVSMVSTATWLNSYPPWLEQFPPEWIEHLEPGMTDLGNGLGWWGQFVNGRGTFNHKHARMFRETGRLPFPPRRSWCESASLRAHVLEHLRRLG